MGFFGGRKTWDQLGKEYEKAVLAGDDRRVHRILKQKLKIAEEEDDFAKKLIVNAEWLSLKERLGID